MEDVVILHLPFPPSVNNYYAKTRNGIFIKAKGKKFREDVISAVNEQGCYMLGLEEKLKAIVIIHWPDKRVRDIDNYLKGLFDAITHAGVWVDDKQVRCMMVFDGENVKDGKVVVAIKEDGGFRVPLGCESVIINEFME